MVRLLLKKGADPKQPGKPSWRAWVFFGGFRVFFGGVFRVFLRLLGFLFFGFRVEG